jgi:hypothetical protein
VRAVRLSAALSAGHRPVASELHDVPT